jgi:hypothetical protein
MPRARASTSPLRDADAIGPFASEPAATDHVLTPDELVDVSARDSFPASDPPSYGGGRPGAPAQATPLKPSRMR